MRSWSVQEGPGSGRRGAHADDLLADWRGDFLAVYHDVVVSSAAIISVKRQEAGFAMPIPGDVSGRILHKQIKIVGVFVRPIHRDDELGLGIDLALLGMGRDREKRQEEQESDHLQRLEQHHAERIEILIPRVEAEIIQHGGVPRPV